jgi:DNA-binding CsgD family transcriptional regulator
VDDERTKTLASHDEKTRGGRPRLEIVKGPHAGRDVEVSRKTFTIGRSVTADLPLDADGVSRKHVKVTEVAKGQFNLIDLGSTNGTFLNERRVDIAPLRDGDQIQVGQIVLRFGWSSPHGEAEPPRKPKRSRSPTLHNPLEMLSARERQVSGLVAEGLTNAEIGKRLHISGRTVATHLANIYERLNIHNRAALARCVVEWGLVQSRG